MAFFDNDAWNTATSEQRTGMLYQAGRILLGPSSCSAEERVSLLTDDVVAKLVGMARDLNESLNVRMASCAVLGEVLAASKALIKPEVTAAMKDLTYRAVTHESSDIVIAKSANATLGRIYMALDSWPS